MASMWRKTMLYLGLGPDDEYDEDDAVETLAAPAPAREPASVSTRPAAPTRTAPSPAPRTRPQAVPAQTPASAEEGTSVRTLPGPGAEGGPKPRPVVRPVPASASAKPHLVTPVSFNQAQELADKFKANQPVILNLQEADRDLSRRLIDFSSGLCYGLGGHMEKVANQVYLLTPTNVEVSADERRRLHERGLHDA